MKLTWNLLVIIGGIVLLLFFWVACLVRHPIRKFKRNESVTEKRISCPCICQEIQKMNRAEVHPPVTGCSRCVQSLSLCSCAEETPSTDFHPQPTRKWKDSQISHQSASEANLALSSHECAVSPNCQNDFACTLQRDVVEGSVHHLRESAAMESQMHRANIQTSNKFSNPVPLRSRPSVHVQALGKDFASMLRLDAERITQSTNNKQSDAMSSLNFIDATASPREENKEIIKSFCDSEEDVPQCYCSPKVRSPEHQHQRLHREFAKKQRHRKRFEQVDDVDALGSDFACMLEHGVARTNLSAQEHLKKQKDRGISSKSLTLPQDDNVADQSVTVQNTLSIDELMESCSDENQRQELRVHPHDQMRNQFVQDCTRNSRNKCGCDAGGRGKHYKFDESLELNEASSVEIQCENCCWDDFVKQYEEKQN